MDILGFEHIPGLFTIRPKADDKEKHATTFITLAREHIIKMKGEKKDIAKNMDAHLYG